MPLWLASQAAHPNPPPLSAREKKLVEMVRSLTEEVLQLEEQKAHLAMEASTPRQVLSIPLGTLSDQCTVRPSQASSPVSSFIFDSSAEAALEGGSDSASLVSPAGTFGHSQTDVGDGAAWAEVAELRRAFSDAAELWAVRERRYVTRLEELEAETRQLKGMLANKKHRSATVFDVFKGASVSASPRVGQRGAITSATTSANLSADAKAFHTAQAIVEDNNQYIVQLKQDLGSLAETVARLQAENRELRGLASGCPFCGSTVDVPEITSDGA